MQTWKKITAILLVLAAVLALCSCRKNGDIPDGMKLVESDFVNYKLYIPENWVADLTVGTVTARANDNSNISVQTMTPSGNFESVDNYFRTDYYPKVQSTFKNTVLIEDECSTENQKFSTRGIACCKYVYTVESDGATYKILQYFTGYGGYLYIFTYTAQEALFAKHLEEVSDMVQNFTF